MKKIDNPGPFRIGLFRALLLAAPLGFASVGQAAAESHPARDSSAAVTLTGQPLAAPALQSGREGMAPQRDRRSANRQRQAPRGERREGRFGPAARWFGRRMSRVLELTEEQRGQMREAMRDIGDNRRNGRRQIADARRSFHRAAQNLERTAEEVQTLGEALGRAQAEVVLMRRAERERIAGILTEEQLQRLDQMRQRSGHRSRSGRRRG